MCFIVLVLLKCILSNLLLYYCLLFYFYFLHNIFESFDLFVFVPFRKCPICSAKCDSIQKLFLTTTQDQQVPQQSNVSIRNDNKLRERNRQLLDQYNQLFDQNEIITVKYNALKRKYISKDDEIIRLQRICFEHRVKMEKIDFRSSPVMTSSPRPKYVRGNVPPTRTKRNS